jgi:hypothetical protein
VLPESPPENPYRSPKAPVGDRSEREFHALERTMRVLPAAAGWQWWMSSTRSFARSPWIWIGIALLFTVICLVLSRLPGAVWFDIAVQMLLFSGLCWAGLESLAGREVRFAHLFAAFGPKLWPLASIGIIGSVMFVVFFLVVGIIIGIFDIQFDFNNLLAWTTITGNVWAIASIALLSLVFFTLLSMACLFAPVLVMHYHQAGFDAMRLSFYACLRNWLSISVASAVGFILMLVATPLTLGLALLVVMPLMSLVTVVAALEIFGEPL